MKKGTRITSQARWLAVGFAAMAVAVSTALYTLPAQAHGEKAQAPFLRMRTFHWYNVKWSDEKLAVNDKFVLSGNFHVFTEWPRSIALPKKAYLNVGQPGPVMFRTGMWVNGLFVPRTIGLLLGGNYKFKVVEFARRPGRWHIHALLDVKTAGPLIGPGKYVTITGDLSDFQHKVTALTGQTINISKIGTTGVLTWWALWYIIGIVWMWWWARRPLFLPRYMRVQDGEQTDDLITSQDRKVATGTLIGTLVLVLIGYNWAEDEYPVTIPLQAGFIAKIEPLPVDYASMVSAEVLSGVYRVPGRSLQFKVELTNHTDRVLQIAEFEAGNVRFINPKAADRVDTSGYPENILAPDGMKVSQQTIAPGETTVVQVNCTDAAWAVQRLVGLVNDVDMRFGGLLFFVDKEGNKIFVEVGGPLIPVFV